ncbi:carbohydrate ABC transporter membrane protein 2, CUT1 family (TC 3.A.1.1.-) [Arthrobacter sp. 31Cvi3.1E]|nr:carbohydrate ABC transporter membrane protein 2, CUT1 family (TC 3.A.1.1.-) [Arthrobacter sp. 31Cvi3.1E]
MSTTNPIPTNVVPEDKAGLPPAVIRSREIPATKREGLTSGTRRRGARPAQAAGTKQNRTSQLLVLVGMGLAVIYSAGPIWWLIVASTKGQSDLYGAKGLESLWFANFNLWENLQQIFVYDDGYYFRWMLNSVLYAGVGSFVAMLISLAAGYGLARYEFRGKKVVFGAVVASFLLPSALLTIPLYLQFSSWGLVGTPWAVLIPSFISPFSVYLAKVYIEGAIPAELLEAARIDGAGEFRIFVQVVMRLMTTGAATIFLLAFVGNWNSFFLPLTMLGSSGKENWPLALGLYNWAGKRTLAGETVDGTSMLILGSLLAIIPLAIFMIAMQRFWKSGVTLGAVK